MSRQTAYGIILKVKPYLENSALVTVFSRESGRFAGVFKGVRKRKTAVRLAAFSAGTFTIGGRSNLQSIYEFEFHKGFNLTGDALACGFYVLELVDRSLEERQVDEVVFDLMLDTLEGLQRATAAPLLRSFESGLLHACGFAVDYSMDAHGVPIDPKLSYRYLPEVGFEAVSADVPGAHTGDLILALAGEKYDSAQLMRAAKSIHQTALLPLIGPKPLTSRSLLSPRVQVGR